MQRCLVGDGTANGRGAVAVTAEAQAVKPGSPPTIEVPLETKLVKAGLVAIAISACFSAHLLLSAGVAIRAGVNPKLEADVVRRHHHRW